MRKICPSAQNRDPLRFIAIQDLPGLFVSFHLQSSQLCFCVCVIDSDLAFICVCVCLCWMSRCVSLMEFADRKERISKVHVTVTLCYDKGCLSLPVFVLTLLYLPVSPHFLPLFLLSPVPSVLPPIPLLHP